MVFTIGIRREDKNKWERRTPIIPAHVKNFNEQHDIHTIVQPSPIRIFSDDAYRKVGATIEEDMSPASVIFAVKEIPLSCFQPQKTYVFFSHTIKGQTYNMPMLKKMMDLQCNLIDYEKIADDRNRRLVFFGHYAGLAGMIDSLWALGQRLTSQGFATPLADIKQTIAYHDLEEVKDHFKLIGKQILKNGFPSSLAPIVIGLAGYGHVSQGAQEILDSLPVKELEPADLLKKANTLSSNYIYKVVFKEEHMVEPNQATASFDLQDYYQHPEKYHSVFDRYLPHLTILMNCIYWNRQYPRLVTKDYVKSMQLDDMRLQVIGDISIDLNGAVEFTEKATTPDAPTFVYDPQSDSITDGIAGKGIAVMAVDNLPCELPKESSKKFSKALYDFVPAIAKADYRVPFNVCQLPPEVKKAVILYHGKLTEKYTYLEQYLS